jgi:hypothetical protein
MSATQKEKREHIMKTANETSIYTTMVFWILVTVVGVFLRFVIDTHLVSIISWVILFVGAIMACKTTFRILNAK